MLNIGDKCYFISDCGRSDMKLQCGTVVNTESNGELIAITNCKGQLYKYVFWKYVFKVGRLEDAKRCFEEHCQTKLKMLENDRSMLNYRIERLQKSLEQAINL